MSMPVDQLQIREQVTLKISQTLLGAYIAAMQGREITEHFDVTFKDDYNLRVRFLWRLKEICEHDTAGVRYVRELMGRIEATFDLLPAPKKRSADSVLVQLAALLPEDERRAELGKLVAHDRISRRVSAYKFIKQTGDPRYKDALIRSCQMYGDEQALITLLRIGGCISDAGVDVVAMIKSLKERYHQALAIETILVRDQQQALSLAPEFPMAFIWAAGRQRHARAKPFVMERFSEALGKTHAATTLQGLLDSSRELGLFVWALGRLNAKKELANLSREYDIAVPWDRATRRRGSRSEVG